MLVVNADGAALGGGPMGYTCWVGGGMTGKLQIHGTAQKGLSLAVEGEEYKLRTEGGAVGGFRHVPGAPITMLKSGVVNPAYAPGLGQAEQRTHISPELPSGEWNKLELRCQGDRVTVLLNEQFVNRASKLTVTKGRISVQSAGLEVFIRRLDLQPLAVN